MPDDNTNLPILNDIIKPGDTDKAVHLPASKAQSSIWSDEEEKASSSTRSDADALDQMEVPSINGTDDELTVDEHLQGAAYAEDDETRESVINSSDIDKLTDEILDNLILQIEPLLRDRIQQTLNKHFAGDAGSD